MARGEGLVGDTLHFYRRDPPGISVGYFKKVHEDVDLVECTKRGVVVVRRTSGGGTIFTDRNQLIYGLVTGKRLAATVEESFKVVCLSIVRTLAFFGVDASYKPPNDIIVNGKKVSGSAQTLKEQVMLMHGTVILDLDTELMGAVLKEKRSGYVSSIKKETGLDIPLEELKKRIVKDLMDTLKEDHGQGSLTEYENQLIEELIQNKYGSDEWNLKR